MDSNQAGWRKAQVVVESSGAAWGLATELLAPPGQQAVNDCP